MADEIAKPPVSELVETVASAMAPILFNGKPDRSVGPATRMEREKLRRYARKAIEAICNDGFALTRVAEPAA